MIDDKKYQIENLERIFDAGAFSPIFKSNPKYPIIGSLRISYNDVMNRKCIIRCDKDFSENSFWSKNADVIVEYKNIKDLVNDGWQLD